MTKRTASDRRTEALARLTVSNGETPQQRIARLDARLGIGVGASRERARLTAMRGAA